MSSEQEAGNPSHDDDDASVDGNGNTGVVLPKPTAAEVHACQFSSWYYTFRNMDHTSVSTIINKNNRDDNSSSRNNNNGNNNHKKRNNKLRKNITIESIVIRPLPADFINYLLSDGVRLPECASRVSSCMNDNPTGDDDDDDDDDDDVNNSSEEEEDNEPKIKYSFPSLTQQLQSAITQLGNICMPKMNWSSPKDATWINCGTLKCSTPGDVYLLLKSSDFIVFDLEKAWEDLHEEEEDDDEMEGGKTENNNNVDKLEHLRIDEPSSESNTTIICSPSNECTSENITQRRSQHSRKEFENELILRKWCNLHPSMEFRCFIYEHELGEHKILLYHIV
jgi:hypothetical protein